jgi:hypothetical protein
MYVSMYGNIYILNIDRNLIFLHILTYIPTYIHTYIHICSIFFNGLYVCMYVCMQGHLLAATGLQLLRVHQHVLR